MYGPQVPPPKALLRTRWGQEPYAFGAYSFVAHGATSADYDLLAASVGNRLFFAGEHTHRAYRGAAHGAYLSGQRAAQAIRRLV
jgi:monoamine oxidase